VELFNLGTLSRVRAALRPDLLGESTRAALSRTARCVRRTRHHPGRREPGGQALSRRAEGFFPPYRARRCAEPNGARRDHAHRAPVEWPLLVDRAVTDTDTDTDTDIIVIGSGLRRSKILLPGEFLARIPNSEIITGLGT
jgi:hypothetical protein